jgi:hypothetical protein
MQATRGPADPKLRSDLVLRYPLPGVAVGVVVCLGMGVVMFLVPVSPGDRLLFADLGLGCATLGVLLAWYMSIRIIVDENGVTRRRIGQGATWLAWADVARVTTWLGESVRLIGREGEPTIGVSSSLMNFPAFLDRLESRPEYDRWVRGEADPGELGPGVSARFTRPGPLAALGLLAAGLWTLAVVFLLSPAMFQGWRGRGPKAELFNLAFIDHPAVGQALLLALAIASTVAPLVFWHTLRVEHDAIELESLTRTRTIPLDEIAGIDLKLDRGGPTDRVKSFDHVLTLRLADGRAVSPLRGETARRARAAISRALDARRDRGEGLARRESAAIPSGLRGDYPLHGGSA